LLLGNRTKEGFGEREFPTSAEGNRWEKPEGLSQKRACERVRYPVARSKAKRLLNRGLLLLVKQKPRELGDLGFLNALSKYTECTW